MAISGGWITPKNDLELPLRGLFRIFSLIASRWKERNQHYCYLFYQNLLNHGCYRHSRKIMTYKDNLKTDLIILFKMNMNEAKKLDHILWPYYPYTTIKLCQLYILFTALNAERLLLDLSSTMFYYLCFYNLKKIKNPISIKKQKLYFAIFFICI